jgi:uncharacterized phage-associated protein
MSAMKQPKYSVFDIANYFLLKAAQDGHELLSNLKLQKLVYYAQGLSCVIFDRPLFSEKIVAWSYGPVAPALYQKYKRYQARGIPADKSFDPGMIVGKAKELLDDIYKFFGQYSAIRLMELAHSDRCYIDAGPNNEITPDSMKACLQKYVKDE